MSRRCRRRRTRHSRTDFLKSDAICRRAVARHFARLEVACEGRRISGGWIAEAAAALGEDREHIASLQAVANRLARQFYRLSAPLNQDLGCRARCATVQPRRGELDMVKLRGEFAVRKNSVDTFCAEA